MRQLVAAALKGQSQLHRTHVIHVVDADGRAASRTQVALVKDLVRR